MKRTTTSAMSKPAPLELRAGRFEDVAEVLRLIGRAVTFACREHYDVAQRAAVHATYASTLFVDALAPLETVVAEVDGRVAGFAQLDPTNGRLRALFVDAEHQGRGLGRALLADMEARAAGHGCRRVHGAMSLNAVPFYARAGFHAAGGEERLTTAGVHVPIVRMEKRLV